MPDTAHDQKAELYRPIPVDDISPGSLRRVEIIATHGECSALARRFGDLSISCLKGSLDLMLQPGNGDDDIVIIDISGNMNAHVTQRCVVTSEPVDSTIQVQFDGIVATSSMAQSGQTTGDNEDMGEAPELLGLIGDKIIDLGSVLAEQLALELDPFPRKPGVSFDGYESGHAPDEADEKPNPFAVLAKLKDNRNQSRQSACSGQGICLCKRASDNN